MVGLARSQEFSCGDSLPVWAWNLEDRNVSESAPWTAHQSLKGTVLLGQEGSLVRTGELMNDPRNLVRV